MCVVAADAVDVVVVAAATCIDGGGGVVVVFVVVLLICLAHNIYAYAKAICCSPTEQLSAI